MYRLHKRIGRIEDLGNRSAADQGLTDMSEACRNNSGDRRKYAALAEMVLYLIKAALKLADKLIQR